MSDEAAPQDSNTPQGQTPSAAPDSSEKKAKRPKLLLPILGIAVVIAAVWGYRAWSFGQTHASTDDAQVDSRIASVAPRIGGMVTNVLVDDNQVVKRGQLLAEIDPETYRTALNQALANLALAEAQERQAEVNINLTSQTGNAQIAQAQGGVGQSQGAVGASQSEVGRAVAAVATARAQASGAEANVKAAQAAYKIAVANVARAQDAVREAQALALNARAAVSSAQANVESARATEDRSQKDNQRIQQLLSQGVVSAQAADQTAAALRVATASRQAAEENVRSARAAAQQREAAINTARSGVAAAQAQVAQANAQVQASRVGALAAGESVRQASAAVLTAQSNVTQAQAKVQQAQGTLQQANTAGTQVEISRVALVQAQARVKQAKASVDEARLNLSYTKIVAPIDGRVSRRTATVGQQVAVGTPLMQIVPTATQEIWVTANFKETQLEGVKVGQPVDIEVDALGGEPLKGHVESLSAGTGAKFALLPPDNSTGNFTKVVQRVPIRIAFDPGQAKVNDLAVGMSVIATIDTGRK